MGSSTKARRHRTKTAKPGKRRLEAKRISKTKGNAAKREIAKKKTTKRHQSKPRQHAKSVAQVVAFLKAEITSSTVPPGAHFPLSVVRSLLKPTPDSSILSGLQELNDAGVIALQPDNSFVVNAPLASP